MSSANEVVKFIARQGVLHSRMMLCLGRNVLFLCERRNVGLQRL